MTRRGGDGLKETLRERLAALSRRELMALVALGLIVVAGAALWYARSLPRPVEIRAARPSSPASVRASPSPAVLFIHVAGEVRHPGVYRLSKGDRVIDAIQAAGGPRKKAYLDALNLAALLTDGEQVLVPAAVPSAPVVPGSVVSSGLGAGSTLINVNTASETDLETLPGIGPVLAASIVQYRTEHGAFPSVESLLDVSGIGPATLDEIKDLVTV